MIRRAVVVLAVLLVGLVAGCANPTGSPAGGAGSGAAPTADCGPVTAALTDPDVTPLDPAPTPLLPATVTSADGRTVTVTDVGRILPVNLYGSIAELVFSLGLGGNVVGRDTSTTFPAAAGLPVVTPAGHDLAAEAVLALNPTVVLADRSIGPPEVLNQLRAAGIPVVLIEAEQTLAAVPAHIRAVAAALGVTTAGERLVTRVEAELAEAARSVPAGAPAPRIAFLYLRGTAGVYLIGGKGAGSDAMIVAAGGVDAGSAVGLAKFRPLTSEGLINAAPDVILVMSSGLASVGGVDGLLKLPGVGQTPAGQHRRIVDVDDGVLLAFGTRSGRVVQALARAVHSCRPAS
ncbi:heme/hemin ABC transporter substrate-binding protein [Micromonospora yangpuensis]|uniref:Iron complex transport system substrate-binding protein n=1 Tax=Micromonospora yangpuensis TaxID=683228 RepID=A0A1C6V5R7_9ACTN|nr:ABC transporter substrate-binding protein [Micromonospora yangpuensis]GGM18765.1 ABC transporter substrate-binding protein [Micromonospora yangpuensis]SCL61713.1 iron complex transport system substrate-binding protein [Micromonospora yangpuensis]